MPVTDGAELLRLDRCFAVQTLLDWHRADMDVAARLPLATWDESSEHALDLAAFLGWMARQRSEQPADA